MERGRLVSRVQLPYPGHFLTFPRRRDSPTPYWQHSPFPSDYLFQVTFAETQQGGKLRHKDGVPQDPFTWSSQGTKELGSPKESKSQAFPPRKEWMKRRGFETVEMSRMASRTASTGCLGAGSLSRPVSQRHPPRKQRATASGHRMGRRVEDQRREALGVWGPGTGGHNNRGLCLEVRAPRGRVRGRQRREAEEWENLVPGS